MKKRKCVSTPSVASLIINQLSCTRWSSDCIGLKGWGHCMQSSCNAWPVSVSPTRPPAFFAPHDKCVKCLSWILIAYYSGHTMHINTVGLWDPTQAQTQINQMVLVLYSCLALVGCFPSDAAICFPLCNGISLHSWFSFICRLKASPPTANRSCHLYLIEQLLFRELKQNKETCHGFIFCLSFFRQSSFFIKDWNSRKEWNMLFFQKKKKKS